MSIPITDSSEMTTSHEVGPQEAHEDVHLFHALRHHKPASEETEEKQSVTVRLGLRQLIGHSPPFLAAKEQITIIAQYDVNVLILGDTGTGKEVFARAIHYLSTRADHPFVPVNCGAIPVELVENELFGHERGAFTGAATATAGLIQEAEGGTLFLDEIDALPPLAQVKLLRFLQEKEYRSLGSTKIRHVDLRVVAATNAAIAQAVADEQQCGCFSAEYTTLPFVRFPPPRSRHKFWRAEELECFPGHHERGGAVIPPGELSPLREKIGHTADIPEPGFD